MTIQFPGAVHDLLKELQAKSGAGSAAEVLRKAIALYGVYLSHELDGGAVIFRHKDNTEERLKIL